MHTRHMAAMKTIKGVHDMQSTSTLIPRVRSIALAVMLLGGSASVMAASGQFTFVTGNVFILKGGSTQIQAGRGTEVDPGDIVVTGADGMAQLAMVDQAKLSLRSNTRLVIERYTQAERGGDGALLTLVRGTLRTFTGLLTSNRANYRMQTRVATVGIRGSGNIMNQSDDDSTTTNHTIEGSHEVSSRDGNFAPIITNPNETVRVVFGQAPKIIPTPPSLLDAGKTMVGSGTPGTSGGSASGGDGGPAGPNNPPSGGAPVVGGNGLGFPIVDATVNLTTDPQNLQNIVIATNGTAFSDQAVPGQIGLDGGALRSYTAYAGGQTGTSLNISGGTVSDLQTVVIGGSTSVVLGRWSGVNSLSFSGGSAVVGAGGVHFGYGGSGFPAYLSEVLTGTVSYTRVGATTPTNQLGSLGQLVSSVLDVNFTARTLNATIGISMPTGATSTGGNWTLQANNVPFSFNSFLAFTGGGGLTITNSTGQSSANNGRLSGAIEGSFVGATLNGALVGYGLVDQTGSSVSSHQSISGAIAFQGPSQNAAAQFRDGLVSDPRGALEAATYIRSFATTNRPDEVTVGEQGRVTAFTAPYVVNNRLVGHLNYAQGTSTIVDNGFDPTTGLVWGRWSGGSATIGGNNVSLGNGSLHYIFSATQSGPVSLPLTGSAVYELVGSTRPTDGAGNVGTLNSATLAANFSARTVDTTINVGINGQTWNGSAAGVPIYRDQYFSAYAGSGIAGLPRPATFVITCTPNCNPQVATGSLDGFFTGRSGRGAGVMYNMNRITGTAAFSRRGG
jgi:FecR protein